MVNALLSQLFLAGGGGGGVQEQGWEPLIASGSSFISENIYWGSDVHFSFVNLLLQACIFI